MKTIILLITFLMSFNALAALDIESAKQCEISVSKELNLWMTSQVDNDLDGNFSPEMLLVQNLMVELNTKIVKDIASFKDCDAYEKFYTSKLNELFEIIQLIEAFKT